MLKNEELIENVKVLMRAPSYYRDRDRDMISRVARLLWHIEQGEGPKKLFYKNIPFGL